MREFGFTHHALRISTMTQQNSIQPRGLVFDCDGTLADTMPLHWQRVADDHAPARFAIFRLTVFIRSAACRRATF
jgi:hypothetical protein